MSRRTPSLARRAFPALALTAVGVGLVQGLDRPSVIGAIGAAQTPTATQAPTQVTPAQTAPAQTAAPSQNVAPVTAAPVTAAPVTAAPVTAAPATAAPVTGGTCGEVSGVGAQQAITWNRSYGVIAVSAKFTAAGDLCDASAQWQAYDSKSQRYEEYAVPILNKQAEAADSAKVQGVSGATAITNAYRASLQSAIDNRH